MCSRVLRMALWMPRTNWKQHEGSRRAVFAVMRCTPVRKPRRLREPEGLQVPVSVAAFASLQGTSGSLSLALGSGGTPALGARGAHTQVLGTAQDSKGRAATGGGSQGLPQVPRARSRYPLRWRAHASVLPYAGRAFAGLAGAGLRRFKRRRWQRGLQACEGTRVMEAARDYAGALIRRVPLRSPEPGVPLSTAFPCASSCLALRALRPSPAVPRSPRPPAARVLLRSTTPRTHSSAPLVPEPSSRARR
ncbi:hypothetical protein AAY473_017314 [Plecturocebus cupreus]